VAEPESHETSIWRWLAINSYAVDVVGAAGLLIGGLLKLLTLPFGIVVFVTGVSVGVLCIGIVAGVVNTKSVVTLGSLVPDKSQTKKKPRPRTNLILRNIEIQNLYDDGKDGLIEVNLDGQRHPKYCVCLRFANEPVPGQPGQRIRRIRARLIYRASGGEYAPIDRGMWVREEFNAFDLEVGDSRCLVVAVGFPPVLWLTESVTGPWSAFAPGNNHDSPDHYDAPVFMGLEHEHLDVHVLLLAGDGGHVLYDATFDLATKPELALVPKQ